LARELRSLDAPRALVCAAERAARDEVRHTRSMNALARRFGVHPRLPRIASPAPRSLESIACENAAEGCVRETFGALIATWQAKAARDRDVRAAMELIAVDETRHAALSWRVSRWTDTRLSREAKKRVADARRAALRELEVELGLRVPRELVELAGYPRPGAMRRMFATLHDGLWSNDS
jgi:hypothetical protein